MELPQEFLKTASRARYVMVLTGAGISAESGLATFRGQDGWWRNYHPQDLATPQAFYKDPRLVWEWYQWRREQALKAQPNPGHLAIAVMEKLFPEFLLATQNVDGLHQRAGSLKMVELHGNIHRSRCFRCQKPYPSIPNDNQIPPRCSCGGLLRPDVVWFGEELPRDVLKQAWEAASQAQLFFVIGTSGLVQPAASLPLVARRSGAFVIEVNPEESSLTEMADLSLRYKAGEAMPSIVRTMEKARWRKL